MKSILFVAFNRKGKIIISVLGINSTNLTKTQIIVNNFDMEQLNERENILVDLFLLDYYYSSSALLKKCEGLASASSGLEIDVFTLGKKYKISSLSSIRNIFIENGTKFEDCYFEEKPLFQNNQPPSNPKAFFLPVILGFSFSIISLIVFLVSLFCVEKKPISWFFIILVLIFGLGAGITFIITGFRYNKGLERQREIYFKWRKEKQEYDQSVQAWEKRKKEAYQSRLENVSLVYKEEIEEVENEYKTALEKNQKAKNALKEKIYEIYDEVASLSKQSIIPSYYLNDPLVVQRMLFLILNKRADTVKELTNTYETEKWQQEMLGKVGYYNQMLFEQNDKMIKSLILVNEAKSVLYNNLANLETYLMSLGLEG